MLPEFKPTLQVTARLSVAVIFPFPPPTTLFLETMETIAPKEATGHRLFQDQL